MILSTLRISRSAFGRTSCRQGVFQRRTLIAPTAVRQADLVQDLYLNALKAYKSTPIKASDSEGHVQKWSAPKTPVSPEEGNITNELKAYEEQQVDVEGQVASGTAAVEEDWFEEEPEEEAHSSH